MKNIKDPCCEFLSYIASGSSLSRPCPECPVIKEIQNMIITGNKWHTSNRANTTIILDEVDYLRIPAVTSLRNL